ncbi:DNA cytosine methyltransferase [Cryobacterium psychrotolerans]|nr:DNA cytosine methyltransferase [Cryobacterium psychrotolerans]
MGGDRTPIIEQCQRSLRVKTTPSCGATNGASALSEVPDYLRRLTFEETAAIQSFPLGMKWVGPQSSKFCQIGKAAPPSFDLAAAEAVKTALGL